MLDSVNTVNVKGVMQYYLDNVDKGQSGEVNNPKFLLGEKLFNLVSFKIQSAGKKSQICII